MGKVTIAIIGLGGFLGKPALEAIESGKFDDKIQFPVLALSRKDQTSNDKVKYIKTEINNATIPFIVESLKGVDVIIELVSGIPDLLKTLEKVVEKVQPKLYIPSQYGVDVDQVDTYSSGFLSVKTNHLRAIKDPRIKVVDVVTSLFAQEGSLLYEYVESLGIDPQNHTFTQRGDRLTKFSFAKLRDIGFSLISLATVPLEKIPSTVRISSDVITYQDVIDQYEKRHGIRIVTVKTLTKEESLKELQNRFVKDFNFTDPDFTMADFSLYVNGIISQGIDKGTYFSEIHNELVNPKESLWKWSKF